MLQLEIGAERPLRLLLVGAHSDDIEIGCGGTLLSLLRSRTVAVHWVVFSAEDDREEEARRSAAAFLVDAAEQEVRTYRFRDGFFPFEGAAIKESFETLKAELSPDLVFTHRLEDRHQDHRLLAELTWNTFRDHTILEYEIPKWDGDLGRPNLYVPVSKAALARKIKVLMSIYGSQANRHWFTPETFEGLARLRGIECRSPTGFAEAFHSRKLVLEMSR